MSTKFRNAAAVAEERILELTKQFEAQVKATHQQLLGSKSKGSGAKDDKSTEQEQREAGAAANMNTGTKGEEGGE